MCRRMCSITAAAMPCMPKYRPRSSANLFCARPLPAAEALRRACGGARSAVSPEQVAAMDDRCLDLIILHQSRTSAPEELTAC